MDKKLFFCFGLAKSGTTFLQRMLNLHPEVACPAEHEFNYLFDATKSILAQYEGVIRDIARRTGGQEIIPLDAALHMKVFRCTVGNIIYESAQGKRIVGVNDNGILWKMDFYNQLFDAPRLIAIFRNPIDRAISAWHHNIKLAEEENEPGHVEVMNRHGGFDGWVKFCAKRFALGVQACVNFNAGHDNLLLLKYEDLKNNKRENLVKLFHFLGASTDENIIADIIDKSSLEAMRDASSRKEFFRSGSTDMGAGVVSDELRAEVSRIAGPALAAMGYDTFQ